MLPKIVGAIFILALILKFSHSPAQSPAQSPVKLYVDCDQIGNKNERFICYQDASYKAVKSEVSVNQLLKLAKEGDTTHLKEHSIGRAALIHSGYDLNQAADMCPKDCPEGFYHGIGLEWARYAPDKLDDFLEFSKKFCPTEKRCLHELGHFNMAGKKNFGESINICNNFKNNDDFYRCVTGVVHQQFIDFGHRNFLTDCAQYSDRRKLACYQYGSALYAVWSDKKDGRDLVEVCKELEGEVPNSLNQCFVSLRIKAQKKGQAPDDKWCDFLDSDYKKLCLEGLNSNVNPFFGLNCGGEDGISTCVE